MRVGAINYIVVAFAILIQLIRRPFAFLIQDSGIGDVDKRHGSGDLSAAVVRALIRSDELIDIWAVPALGREHTVCTLIEIGIKLVVGFEL